MANNLDRNAQFPEDSPFYGETRPLNVPPSDEELGWFEHEMHVTRAGAARGSRIMFHGNNERIRRSVRVMDHIIQGTNIQERECQNCYGILRQYIPDHCSNCYRHVPPQSVNLGFSTIRGRRYCRCPCTCVDDSDDDEFDSDFVMASDSEDEELPAPDMTASAPERVAHGMIPNLPQDPIMRDYIGEIDDHYRTAVEQQPVGDEASSYFNDANAVRREELGPLFRWISTTEMGHLLLIQGCTRNELREKFPETTQDDRPPDLPLDGPSARPVERLRCPMCFNLYGETVEEGIRRVRRINRLQGVYRETIAAGRDVNAITNRIEDEMDRFQVHICPTCRRPRPFEGLREFWRPGNCICSCSCLPTTNSSESGSSKNSSNGQQPRRSGSSSGSQQDAYGRLDGGSPPASGRRWAVQPRAEHHQIYTGAGFRYASPLNSSGPVAPDDDQNMTDDEDDATLPRATFEGWYLSGQQNPSAAMDQLLGNDDNNTNNHGGEGHHRGGTVHPQTDVVPPRGGTGHHRGGVGGVGHHRGGTVHPFAAVAPPLRGAGHHRGLRSRPLRGAGQYRGFRSRPLRGAGRYRGFRSRPHGGRGHHHRGGHGAANPPAGGQNGQYPNDDEIQGDNNTMTTASGWTAINNRPAIVPRWYDFLPPQF